jgi:hypothetical protein
MPININDYCLLTRDAVHECFGVNSCSHHHGRSKTECKIMNVN